MLGVRVVPNMTEYTRRYLMPLGDGAPEPPFDVATEIVFDNEGAFEQVMAAINEPAIRAELDADEERCFDRLTITFMKVDEPASEIPART